MWEELKRPATLIGIAIGFIGIIAGGLISLYFYEKGEKIGRLSILIDQVQIYDKSRMGQLPLKILDAADHVINDNVFVATVTIWNSGDSEIKKDDIRKEFKISISNNIDPLDVSIIKYSNENIDNFNLKKDGSFTWDHFDQNEGIKIRMVYVSDKQKEISVTGAAVNFGGILYKEKLVEGIFKAKFVLICGLSVLIPIQIIIGTTILTRRIISGGTLKDKVVLFTILSTILILIAGFGEIWWFSALSSSNSQAPF